MNIEELQKLTYGHSLLFEHSYRLLRIHQFAARSKAACAELGVWQGGTAKVIAKSTKFQVNIFDTFEGLPEPDSSIDKLQKGDFGSISFESVKAYLSDCPNIRIFKGYFPSSTTEDIANEKYGFVHLDGDLYSSTMDGLKYFYPKMIDGGVILTDDWDYDLCPGVNKAFDDFCIPYIDISYGQCIIIK